MVIIKDLGLITTLTSGGITIYSFYDKKMRKYELIKQCEELRVKQELQIKAMELKRSL